MENDYRITDKLAEAYDSFAVRMMNQCSEKDKNVMISPLSVLSALKMAEEGAAGKTSDEIRNLIGDDVWDESDTLLHDVRRIITRFRSANCAYLDSELRGTVKDGFLDSLRDGYGAELFTGRGSKAVDEINGWVSRNTKGMIPGIMRSGDELGDMMLINANAFEDKWKVQYEADDIESRSSGFVNSKGAGESAEMLNSTEAWWLENRSFIGFIKPYRDDRFSFAGLLPKDGKSLENELTSMTGSDWHELISGKLSTRVHVEMPEFRYDYNMNLNDALSSLGVRQMFDPETADFSRMTDISGTHVSKVLHGTHIEVDRSGTRAAAYTSVAFALGCSIDSPKYMVILDRPFLFAVIHSESGIPIFLGTVNSLR